MIVEPGPLVADQDAGALVGAVVGQGEGADHGAAVGLVGDVAGGGHGCTVPSTRCSHTGGHAREPWSATAIGIGRPCGWRRRWLLAACGSGFPDADLAPAPPRRRRPRRPAPARHHDASRRRASGPLQAGSPIALPFSADRVAAAESPDGAVFAAPQDPTSPSPSIAWVDRRQRPGADRRARADRHRRAGRRRHQLLRGDVLHPVRLQPPEREPGRAVDDALRAHGEQLEQRPRCARRGERLRLRLGDPGQHGQRVHRQPGRRRPRRTCS